MSLTGEKILVGEKQEKGERNKVFMITFPSTGGLVFVASTLTKELLAQYAVEMVMPVFKSVEEASRFVEDNSFYGAGIIQLGDFDTQISSSLN